MRSAEIKLAKATDFGLFPVFRPDDPSKMSE